MEPDASLEVTGDERYTRRIGVFGGTFDPPHLGHLIVATDVVAALDLDGVLWVPAGEPPHKRDASVSPAEVRLEMTRAAVGGDPRFEVSDIEVRRRGPSYTVDTLRDLRAGQPKSELHLLLGMDQLAVFHTWRAPEEVARLARLVVMERSGSPVGRTPPLPGLRWERVSVTRIDISSTDVRERVARGEDARYRVTEDVRRMIEDHGLYTRGS